jgi:ribosomal protein L37AE/L43A
MSDPEVAEEPDRRPGRRPSVKVRELCERCKRVNVKESRKAYTWRCNDCGFVNIGPGYREQDKTPPEGTRRRVAQRERAAEQRAERGAAGSQPDPLGHRPSPAPVRRKAKAVGAAAPVKEPREEAAPAAAPAAPAARRGTFLDRLLYGEGDE